MGNPNSAVEHISKMNICQGDTFKHKELKIGQKWVLKAFYDYGKYKGVRSANSILILTKTNHLPSRRICMITGCRRT
jgi:hypothetical protein